jgi:hypothetical protein
MKKLLIDHECVWRFIGEHLDDIYDKKVVLDILLFIRNKFIEANRKE